MVKQNGFSLIETMVTLFVSTVGILGVGLLQLQSIQTSGDAAFRSNATWIAQDIVERMRINPKGAKANAYSGTVACGNAPAKMCSSHYTSTRVAGVVCDADEVAIYDMWDLVCGLATDNDQFRDSNDFVSDISLSLSCDDANNSDGDACSAGSDITVALDWSERGVDEANEPADHPPNLTLQVRL